MHDFFSRRCRALVFLLLLAAAPAWGGALDKLFAPQPQLWSRWTVHNDASAKSIDHGAWSRFLGANLRSGPGGVSLVAYGRVSGKDRKALNDYIAGLSSLPISRYSRREQLAYWINLYNALTLKTVLSHYPVKSIRDIDISPGPFADGPWKRKLVTVEGQEVSLDDIEHRILRPIWKDPRVHYAVNCASMGCPSLQGQAFTARSTPSLMERAARDYVNSPRGVGIDGGRLVLSSVYNWFGSDFADDGGVIAHLRRYAAPELAAELERFDSADDYTYDWRLNDAR